MGIDLALLLEDEDSLALMLDFFLLPLTLAPGWIQAIAAVDSFSYTVDAARFPFDGDLGDVTVLFGFGIVAVLAVLALWWAARSFRRAIS